MNKQLRWQWPLAIALTAAGLFLFFAAWATAVPQSRQSAEAASWLATPVTTTAHLPLIYHSFPLAPTATPSPTPTSTLTATPSPTPTSTSTPTPTATPIGSANPNPILFLRDAAGDNTMDLYAMPLTGAPVQRLTQLSVPWSGQYLHPNVLNSARWSPDGQQVAFVYNYVLYVMNHDGSNLRPIWGNGTTLAAKGTAKWSPDSQRVAVIGMACDPDPSACSSAGSGLFVVNPATTDATLLMPNTLLDPPTGVHWTADGQRILAKYLQAGSTIFGLLSIPTNGDESSLIFGDYTLEAISLSPSGTQFLFTYSSSILYLANVDGTGTPVTVFNGFNTGHSYLGGGWRLDGQRVLIRAYSSQVGGWEVYTADPDGQNQLPVNLPHSPSSPLFIYGWTADNRILYTINNTSGDLSETDIYVMDADGANSVNLTAGNADMDFVVDYRP
ncbi:MAG: DPP IV N-terminal domain-containing protein [Chloroflexi bacterium]|nr:DPP IV N-terminal domain-containing protein [Chloroflexota bacterium]